MKDDNANIVDKKSFVSSPGGLPLPDEHLLRLWGKRDDGPVIVGRSRIVARANAAVVADGDPGLNVLG